MDYGAKYGPVVDSLSGYQPVVFDPDASEGLDSKRPAESHDPVLQVATGECGRAHPRSSGLHNARRTFARLEQH